MRELQGAIIVGSIFSKHFGIQWFDVLFFKVNQKVDCNIFFVPLPIFNAYLKRSLQKEKKKCFF
jgi:hypothetical protein